VKQQVVLQDLAFTAEDSSSNETLSGSKVHSKGHLWHLLTWLYVEESTSKHLVPVEPLHPASSNRHPAKSRFLTTRRAWLANAILTCHGLATLKGSPPRCRYQFHRRRIGLCWAKTSGSGDAFYEHILSHMMFFTTMLVLSCVFSLFSLPYLNTLLMHTTNQLTAHVANKGTPEQLSLHFPQKWRNCEASTFFKSSMFCSSSLFREHARPFSCQKLNKH